MTLMMRACRTWCPLGFDDDNHTTIVCTRKQLHATGWTYVCVCVCGGGDDDNNDDDE